MRLAILLAVASVFSSCRFQSSSMNSVSFVNKERPSYDYLWDHLAIRVCWDEPGSLSNGYPVAFDPGHGSAFSDQRKTSIRSTVSAAYSRMKTGIHFTGWESCQDARNPDVRIVPALITSAPIGSSRFAVNSNAGGNGAVSTFRYSLVGVSPQDFSGIPFYLGSDDCKPPPTTEGFLPLALTEEDCIRVTVLHEFGHIAGRFHEHIRQDAAEDPKCQRLINIRARTAIDLQEPEADNAYQPLMPYDASSIMNYCHFHGMLHGLVELEVGISEKDEQTLMELYKHLL